MDPTGWFPPTPRIPLLELPPLPLPPLPVFRLHPALTAVTYHWEVRLDPEPVQLTTEALTLPAFDSPPTVEPLRLHFSPLASTPGMDYTYAVTTLPGAPITIGDVFRAIHNAVSARLAPAVLAHWRSDAMRRRVERAFRRRTTGVRRDVLRNVDLHMADGRAALFFHGIAVEQVEGPYGLYTVFRVVLREDPPFP